MVRKLIPGIIIFGVFFALGFGIRSARQVTNVEADSGRVNLLQIESAVERKAYGQAIELIRSESRPGTANTQLELYEAKALRGIKQWDRAEEIYKKVLEEDPTNTEATWDLLDIYYVEQRWKEAEEIAIQCYHNSDPGSDRISLLLEVARLDIERLGPGTIAWHLEPVLLQEPNNYHALRNTGRSYVIVGRASQGYEYLEKAIALHPQDADAWLDMAHCLNENGLLSDLRKLLDKMPESGRGDIRFWRLMGYAQDMAGDTERAEQSFRHALDLEPTDRKSLFLLATVLRKRNQLESARQLEERARELTDSRNILHDHVAELMNNLETVPVDLLVRIGALCKQLGRARQAELWENEVAVRNKVTHSANQTEG